MRQRSLASLTVLLILAGCWGNSSKSPTGTGGGAESTNQSALPAPPPLLKDWQVPKLALVLSGEQNGYLEPCGCSATQSGGFARRADLFAQLEAKKFPVLALDLGNTLKRSRRLDVIKFEIIQKGLKEMHYAAMGLGPSEMRLGAETLLSMHQPDAGLGYLCCNMLFFGSPDLGTPLSHKIIDINGVKVGVTAVVSPTYRDEVLPRELPDDAPIRVTDPVEGIKAALVKMEGDAPAIRVLLSYGRTEETREYLKQFPEFQVALSAGGPEEPAPQPEKIGQSLLVLVGGKGKHVGILGYYPDDKENPFKFELVNLDNQRFKNQPSMETLMQEFQDRLTSEDLARKEKRITHDSGHTYVGAKKCGECHTKAYDKWRNSKHAQAYDSLIKGRENYEGKWIVRTHDSECLACHVTGWNPQEVLPYESGFLSADETPHLKGQQCENCHGPGSEHTELEEAFKKTRGKPSDALLTSRKSLHLDSKLAQDRVCYQCHDSDNSPKFKFDEYWKKIDHKGLRD